MHEIKRNTVDKINSRLDTAAGKSSDRKYTKWCIKRKKD